MRGRSPKSSMLKTKKLKRGGNRGAKQPKTKKGTGLAKKRKGEGYWNQFGCKDKAMGATKKKKWCQSI